jgi:glyoxylase-like metal-dependent hydrolase (beta-lactamase superfamily II)
MIIKTIPVGQLEANCYVLADEDRNEAIIVDPGDEPDRILDEAGDAEVTHIVLTHAHFDHAGAVAEIKKATGAPIVLHEDEQEVYASIQDHGAFWGFKVPPPPPPDLFVQEGHEIPVGKMLFSVLHTPGHSPGGICLYIQGTLITGDTLFMGSVGRTDLPGGSMAELRESFRKLMSLPDDTRVYPGHGPMTTIGKEKVENMFAGHFL